MPETTIPKLWGREYHEGPLPLHEPSRFVSPHLRSARFSSLSFFLRHSALPSCPHHPATYYLINLHVFIPALSCMLSAFPLLSTLSIGSALATFSPFANHCTKDSWAIVLFSPSFCTQSWHLVTRDANKNWKTWTIGIGHTCHALKYFRRKLLAQWNPCHFFHFDWPPQTMHGRPSSRSKTYILRGALW